MIEVKKMLFARQSHIGHMIGGQMRFPPVFVCVEALNKDHAIERLKEKYPFVESHEWDFLEELDPEHDLGALGETLKLPRFTH